MTKDVSTERPARSASISRSEIATSVTCPRPASWERLVDREDGPAILRALDTLDRVELQVGFDWVRLISLVAAHRVIDGTQDTHLVGRGLHMIARTRNWRHLQLAVPVDQPTSLRVSNSLGRCVLRIAEPSGALDWTLPPSANQAFFCPPISTPSLSPVKCAAGPASQRRVHLDQLLPFLEAMVDQCVPLTFCVSNHAVCLRRSLVFDHCLEHRHRLVLRGQDTRLAITLTDNPFMQVTQRGRGAAPQLELMSPFSPDTLRIGLDHQAPATARDLWDRLANALT